MTWLAAERRDMAAHKFKVGQLVTLHSKRHGVFAEPFEVVRLLPPANGDFPVSHQVDQGWPRTGRARERAFGIAHPVMRC